MRSDPTVSIIIPCYNAARTLRETLDSALKQTFEDFEIVAVDDGATDGTAGILLDYAAKHPKFRVVRQHNGGLAQARNSGIAASRGRFLALLDADDLIDPTYIAAHVAHLEAARIDISFGRVRYIDRDGRPTGKSTRPKLDRLEAQDFLISNPCTAFLVIRRKLFDTVGAFNPNFRRVEDQEWLFRARHAGARIAGLDTILASYRIMPGSLSADTRAMEAAFTSMLERARELAPDLVARHERRARGTMQRYCARRLVDHGGDQSEARRHMLKALQTAPGLLLSEPKSTLATLLAVAVPRLQPLLFAERRGLEPVR
jgi:glycosyltransferase involved in cell wall biosynthesis